MRIHARKLLRYSASDLMTMLTGQFTLVFDNGEVETDWKETVYSRHMWEYHVQYPDAPLNKEHHLQHVSKDRSIKSGTHGKLISVIHWCVYDTEVVKIPNIDRLKSPNPPKRVGEAEHKLRDNLSQLAYRVVNDLYNFSVLYLSEYMTSLDIVDFTEIILHPEIKKIKSKMVPTPESVDSATRQISNFIKTDPSIDHNRLVKTTRAGLVRMEQVLQCIGPRGIVTETDSSIFTRPVMSGFAEGIRPLFESLIESRSAAKHLAMSKQELQDSEYFSRRLQLVAMGVQHLHMSDCGSKTYLHMLVQEDDLPLIAGKYYLNEYGKLQVVRKDSFELIGRSIDLRAVIHCNHLDEYGICSTCFGEMAYSVPAGTNIGHLCVTELTRLITQGVLSVKHSDSGSGADHIKLRDEAKPFFRVSTDGYSYVFNKSAANSVKTIVLAADICRYLEDIYHVDDVRNLNVSNITEIESIGLIYEKGKTSNLTSILVKQEGKLPSLSHDFLAHIKEVAYTTDAKGNHHISLEGWDFEKSVMNMPLRHYNMADHSKEISDLIEAKMKDMIKRDKHVSPDALLIEFYNMANSKLSVNLAVLDVIIYGTMIRSAEKWDYNLPKENTERGIGVQKNLMAYRSLGAYMAYQEQDDVIMSTRAFLQTNRPDHPFDMILMPELANPQ